VIGSENLGECPDSCHRHHLKMCLPRVRAASSDHYDSPQDRPGEIRAQEPNRISSSGYGCPDRFKLDQPSWVASPEPCRTASNCNPDCNPALWRDPLLRSCRSLSAALTCDNVQIR
jgi:hypothetical protein